MSDLHVKFTDVEGATIVRVDGDLGLGNVDQFQAEMRRLLAYRPKRIVFDLGGMAFVSSLGMGEMVAIRDAVHRHGCTIVICGLQAPVREAFNRARLGEVFKIYDDVATAVRG